MYLFRFIWILVFNLVLAAYCWGSASSPGERAARNAENNLNKLYFNYVFAEENERLLRAIMVSVRRLYDRNELEKSLESHSAPDHQIADRQQLLTDLVQQATRHAIAKINGSDELGNSDLPMFHILQALSNAPSMQESLDVVHWYSTQPVLLNGVMAEDRMDSLENLIQEAVHNSFREFPSNPPSREQLARQLGFILLEMQELFLRGKVLRSLSYKIDKQKQNPKIASDPAFKIYLSLLTETFNKNPTLWHTNSKGRQYQEDLSALFIKAADREDYGNEWYQQIRKILDGQKPVRVTPPPSDQRSARHHYDDDDDEEEGWFELTPLRVVLGVGAIYGGFLTIIACLAIFGSDTESAMRERRQEEELQEKLGKALYKPGQKGAKRKGAKRKGLRPRKGNKPGQQDSEDEEQYPKPTKKTLKEIIDIKKTVSDRLWDNLMYRVGIEAGVLSPLLCNMDPTDVAIQIAFEKISRYLHEKGYIVTDEERERQRQAQREYAERCQREQEEAAKRGRTYNHTNTNTNSGTTSEQDQSGSSFDSFFEFAYENFPSGDVEGGATFGTGTTGEAQGQDAEWEF